MTQDEILSAAKEADIDLLKGESAPYFMGWVKDLETFAKIIERKTIERCAVVAEESTCECCWSEEAINASNECAAAIRNLGEE